MNFYKRPLNRCGIRLGLLKRQISAFAFVEGGLQKSVCQTVISKPFLSKPSSTNSKALFICGAHGRNLIDRE